MVALIPGRFDPVHLGHILTIMRIYDDYDKIIVAITEDDYNGKKPPIVPMHTIYGMLHRIFQYLPKIRIIFAGEGFRIRERFDDLPKFDVVLSGNEEVLKNMAIHKIRAKFIERTQGIGFSGTELRQLIR